MFVFVLNCGSSSFKYQLLDMSNERRVAAGLVERIGMQDSILSYEPANGDKIKEVSDIAEMIYTASKLSAQAVVENMVIRPQLGDL